MDDSAASTQRSEESVPATGPRLSYLPEFNGRLELYKPLDPENEEIRIITILPSTDRAANIICTLRTISLLPIRGYGNEPQENGYNAVSYYWGSTVASNRETIRVRDETADAISRDYEVPVTKQLTAALRQFRARATATGENLVLWTDAICIKQLDPDERSQQILLMQDIYAHAQSVWIWLGESDYEAEKGLANLFGLAVINEDSLPASERASRAPENLDYWLRLDLVSTVLH